MYLTLFLIACSAVSQAFNIFREKILKKHPRYEKYFIIADLTSIAFLLYVGFTTVIDETRQKEIAAQTGVFGKQKDATLNSPEVYLGNGRVSETPNPIRIEGEAINPITATYANGQIQVVSYVKDLNGDIIAKILGREWTVTNPQDIDFNYDDSAFEIVNEEGRVYYQLQLKDGAVHLRGMVCSGLANMCFTFQEGTSFVNTRNIKQRIAIPASLNIKPLFKYPRKNNLSVRSSD